MEFIYIRRCQRTLRWLAHFFENQTGTLRRVVRQRDDSRRPLQLVSDASPWGGGALLWEDTLPFGAYATPAVYEAAGRQFLVLAAGGGKFQQSSGDAYVAYALPEDVR